MLEETTEWCEYQKVGIIEDVLLFNKSSQKKNGLKQNGHLMFFYRFYRLGIWEESFG